MKNLITIKPIALEQIACKKYSAVQVATNAAMQLFPIVKGVM